jgi:uncharacterized protein
VSSVPPADNRDVPVCAAPGGRCAIVGIAVLLAVLQTPLLAAWPRPSGFVNDFAGVLTKEDVAYLEDYLRAVERDTTAEIVVATVTSLEGMSIEEYGNRLFAEWGIGKRAQDTGILLLVVPAERSVRIEVGYGLEGLVPDGLAGEIIRTVIVPEFKQGNLRRGIGRGLDRLARIVRGDTSAFSSAPARSAPAAPPALFIVLIAGTFVAFGGFVTGLGLRTRTIGPLVAGGGFAAIPLFGAAVMQPASLAVLMPLELLAVVLGYRTGRADYWMRTLRAKAPAASDEPTVWIAGGTSGSSSSDSSYSSDSSDSSSSSFGGGSSGGGGASGNW